MLTLDLSLVNVKISRLDRCLLSNISFSLTAGDICQLLGPNGIGKTTLLRCIAGLLPIEQGRVSWNKLDIQKDTTEFHASLCYIGHKSLLHPQLTVLENIRFAFAGMQLPDAGKIKQILSGLKIDNLMTQFFGSLSQGQQQRVKLSLCLLSPKKLWMIDEPFVNIDQAGIDFLQAQFLEHANHGGMILLTSHQALNIESLSLKKIDLSDYVPKQEVVI